MARTDALTRFSDAQAIIADAWSTNSLDLVGADRRAYNAAGDTVIGNYQHGGYPQLYLRGFVSESFNLLTSLRVTLYTNDSDTFALTDDEVLSKDIPLADLVLPASDQDGYPRIDLGSIPGKLKRYVKAYYDVVGTDPTTGEITLSLIAR